MTENDQRLEALETIRERVALLRRLATEDDFGVVIEEGPPLAAVGAPPGLAEVFTVFRRLEGTYFRLSQPMEIGDPTAWETRPVNPSCPLGSPITIGCERYSIPPVATDVECGNPIYLDVTAGNVYYIDPDDYLFLYENPGEEVDTVDFAPDVATFFRDWVLGPKYPDLVQAVLGAEALGKQIRKGAQRGAHADSWMRLLRAAGLVGQPHFETRD